MSRHKLTLRRTDPNEPLQPHNPKDLDLHKQVFNSVMVPLRLLNLKFRRYRQNVSRNMLAFHPCCGCTVGDSNL